MGSSLAALNAGYRPKTTPIMAEKMVAMTAAVIGNGVGRPPALGQFMVAVNAVTPMPKTYAIDIPMRPPTTLSMALSTKN